MTLQKSKQTTATFSAAVFTTFFKGIHRLGAGDESRTRDLNLGKVALYQLSYSRTRLRSISNYGVVIALDRSNGAMPASNKSASNTRLTPLQRRSVASRS